MELDELNTLLARYRYLRDFSVTWEEEWSLRECFTVALHLGSDRELRDILVFEFFSVVSVNLNVSVLGAPPILYLTVRDIRVPQWESHKFEIEHFEQDNRFTFQFDDYRVRKPGDEEE